MAKVLITGMSGTGKSTVLATLQARGYETIDTDYGTWTLADGTWDEQRMTELLATEQDIIVSGTVENQGNFYQYFEHIVLLSAPLHVLLERVKNRTNNNYGKTPEQQSHIAADTHSIEPLLRKSATLELDAREPVKKLADCIEKLLET